MAESKVIKFLREYRQYFNLSDIEQSQGIPQSTLTKAIGGYRDLTDEQETKVLAYIKRMRIQLEKILV